MSNSFQDTILHHTVTEKDAGGRLDQVLSQVFPEYSRGFWQKQIKAGQIKVNDHIELKGKIALQLDDLIEINLILPEVVVDKAEAIPLSIIYEDDSILVLNKPTGLVVHPGAGAQNGTLLNGLLHHEPALSHLPRAGIVHRLDKDTTGLMVVAKTPEAHHSLVDQLRERSVSRHYQALVYGEVISGATIDQPIGRHPTRRTEMAVVSGGKPAITHYRISERFKKLTLLDVMLESGRTHQIRVHMKEVGFPLVGDGVYGKRHGIKGLSETVNDALRTFPRQALHAKKLVLMHPKTEELVTWEAPLPDDFKSLLELIREESL